MGPAVAVGIALGTLAVGAGIAYLASSGGATAPVTPDTEVPYYIAAPEETPDEGGFLQSLTDAWEWWTTPSRVIFGSETVEEHLPTPGDGGFFAGLKESFDKWLETASWVAPFAFLAIVAISAVAGLVLIRVF